MNEKKNKEQEEIKEKLKELVIARIETIPSNFKLSIGGRGTLTKDEMVEHVKKGDETGEQIIKMQLNFIKAMTSGELMKTVTAD